MVTHGLGEDALGLSSRPRATDAASQQVHEDLSNKESRD
ncbi:MAG: hypothetical protein K0S94_2318 [Nitrospira sp.]|nr:hypothetical protein [Nitrospira sp.]